MFLARRSLTSLRKTSLQCHSPYPTLFRLDFPFPLVSSQTKQKLPNLSLNSLSFPNNPIHKAWRNRPTSFSSTPTFQFFFFSGTRISFRLSKPSEYTVKPKTSERHCPTSAPPEDLFELDSDCVAEHLKVGVASWSSSPCFSGRDYSTVRCWVCSYPIRVVSFPVKRI